jgi:hypothetical protein
LLDYEKNNKQKFILLVSGRLGEELSKIKFQSSNLIGEYVFCRHIDHHLQWAKNSP